MKFRGVCSPEMRGKILKHNFLLYFKFCSKFLTRSAVLGDMRQMNKGGFGVFSTKEASYSMHEDLDYRYCQAQFRCGFGCSVHKREPDSRAGGWGRGEGRDDFTASSSEAAGCMC